MAGCGPNWAHSGSHEAAATQMSCDPADVHVLLVDDELLSRLVVGECPGERGARPAAADGPQVRVVCARHSPTLRPFRHPRAPIGNLLRKCNYQGADLGWLASTGTTHAAPPQALLRGAPPQRCMPATRAQSATAARPNPCRPPVTVVESGVEALQRLQRAPPGTYQLLLTVLGGGSPGSGATVWSTHQRQAAWLKQGPNGRPGPPARTACAAPDACSSPVTGPPFVAGCDDARCGRDRAAAVCALDTRAGRPPRRQ